MILASNVYRIRLFVVPVILLIVALVYNLVSNPAGVHIGFHDVFQSLRHHMMPGGKMNSVIQPSLDQIIWQIRLPRAIMAILSGSLLATAGVTLQSLLQNPLADPYTVGVSSGAAIGAILADLTGLSLLLGGLGGPFLSIIFGMAAVVIVISLAKKDGKLKTDTFLLAGVVVGTLLWSIIPLLLMIAHRSNDYSKVLFTILGSLQSADWSRVVLLLPTLALTVMLLLPISRELNVMSFGEESAHSIGVNVEKTKWKLIGVCALMTGTVVSMCGIIAFVGLITPHIARRTAGPDHRYLVPTAFIYGGTLILFADTLVRCYLDEMPVGVITSLIGGPMFCWILRANIRRTSDIGSSQST